ncbi:MAG: radical SAM protein, partial [Limisphaerales bacterium]
MISLGCAKNLVDSEIMVGTLLAAGVELTNDPTQADAVIVNTCSFIDSAQEESVDAILESDAVRQAHNRGQGLVVAGCLPQRFRDELPKLLPEVDAFMGIDQVAQVPQIIRAALQRRAARLNDNPPHGRTVKRPRLPKAGPAPMEAQAGSAAAVPSESADTANGTIVAVNARPKYIPDYATPRFRLTPRHFAYVKLAEGCNHPCSFCTIPRMRGTHRSRTQADIVAEAAALVAEGVKELNLISQDSTFYGLDLQPQRSRGISAPGRFAVAVRALPQEATTICS